LQLFEIKFEKFTIILGRECSVHFSPDSFQDTSHLYIPGKPPVLKLQKNAVPTLCLECVEQKYYKMFFLIKYKSEIFNIIMTVTMKFIQAKKTW